MDSGDLHHDMRIPPIDDETADRLLAGAVAPEDAPPGYAPVAALVMAATARAHDHELMRRETDIAAAVAAIGAPPVAAAAPQGGRMTTSKTRFGMKAAALAVPAAVLLGAGAAAATGSLPGPAQSAVHNALSHVGVSVPTSGPDNSGTNGTPSSQSSSNSQAVGPDATGPAAFGLCQAFAASAGHPSANSVAFRNLQKAATAGGFASVTAYCATVTKPGSSSGAGSDSQSGSGSNAPSTTGSGHKPSSVPPSSTPGSGHVPASTPAGPPSSTPAAGHTQVSTPAGPPSSTPASGHTQVSTPAGPPTSTPAGKP
jgi:hypothetical protein